MKKCPACNSTRFKGDHKQKKCFRCGFTWKNPIYHKTVITKKYRRGNDKLSNTTRNNEQFFKIDIHDNVYKFKILKDNPKVSIGKIIRMKNWNMEILERDNIVYRRTPNYIIISLKKRQIQEIKKLNDIDKLEQKIRDTAISLAKAFTKEFKIKLDVTPITIAKEIKLVEAFQSPVQFMGNQVKCVYPDGSIEFVGQEALDSVKNFYENMALETKADVMMKRIDGGFHTLSYLITQQNEILSKQTEILLKAFNTNSSFISRIIRGLMKRISVWLTRRVKKWI